MVALAAAAQAIKPLHTLVSFNKTNGAFPYATLIKASDGNFYGTTQAGGSTNCSGGCGTVFRVTPSGVLTSFPLNGSNGSDVTSGLLQGTDGNLYGTAVGGGVYGHGVVFKVTLSGVITVVHSFNYSDGAGPEGTLIQATDVNFYGTTSYGGTSNAGTVFKLTPAGILTTLHVFNFSPDGCCADSGLIQGADGNFYGNEFSGGIFDEGTTYQLTPAGVFTVLHQFQNTDGQNPYASLILGSNGNFYGTTEEGGEYAYYGTVFEITPSGVLTSLHSFDISDGDVVISPLVLASDGNFYGTTSYGGIHPSFGTIFKITPSGVFTTLYNFNGTEGAYAYGGLIQNSNQVFYGTTFDGGNGTACSGGCGTVYSFVPQN